MFCIHEEKNIWWEINRTALETWTSQVPVCFYKTGCEDVWQVLIVIESSMYIIFNLRSIDSEFERRVSSSDIGNSWKRKTMVLGER
jgi:hypothetical protein